MIKLAFLHQNEKGRFSGNLSIRYAHKISNKVCLSRKKSISMSNYFSNILCNMFKSEERLCVISKFMVVVNKCERLLDLNKKMVLPNSVQQQIALKEHHY